MIINSNDGNLRIKLIAKKVIELLRSGISTNKILVLVQNSFKKELLFNEIQKEIFKNGASCGFSQLNISTFAGITYNAIQRNWVNVEKLIGKIGGETAIMPTLSGLDVSQYFFRKIIKEEDFSDYFSKQNLMHQLLRRYKLVVENDLSPSEIEAKSRILEESFGTNALNAINQYKLASSKNRTFDNLKQISSFTYLLKSGAIKDFDGVEYFLADDVDEYSFAAFEFCKSMIKKAKDSFIYMDKDGCTREGYLCAYPNSYQELKSEFNMPDENIINKTNFAQDAQNLYENITENKQKPLKNFETAIFSKRLEMIESVAKKVQELIKNGTSPNDIQLITPNVDENLVYSLSSFFENQQIKLQLLTGNKKITEDIYVYATITILELLNPSWDVKPNSFEVRILLNEILQIPIFECKEFISYFEKKGVLPKAETEFKNKSYKNLINLINDAELKNEEISTQYERIFSEIIAPNMRNDADFEPISLLLKSISEFEKISKNFAKFDNIKLTPKDWLLHIKNSVVSQNPSKPTHIATDAVLLSTPQKIVDFSLTADYQIWLDTTASDWIKEDTGTIYNAWVFQKNFSQTDFTGEMNREFTLKKTARLLRKLALNAKEKIFAFSSTFDVSGRENYGELANFISIEEEKPIKFNFIPRDDQKEIINYKSGKLAVPAVPGAGKTTVMLGLLYELVKNGANPQEILVLTYMESAARNFLNRFKKIMPNRTKLPQISTIHAFAFKILAENNHYAAVNLPEDFSICDDALKIAIVKDICAKNLPIGETLEEYSNLMLAGISKVKLNQIQQEKIKEEAKKNLQVAEFLQIYNTYLYRLKELSLLDYDDLLLYSIKLLKENPKIAQTYQEKFHFIIEDEAQDSSLIQQEFISILSAKYGNVIRCGDINQAILGTFSNSDVQGFKDFISNNKKIEMFRSQRCAKPIYELANELVEVAKNSPTMKEAFYDLKMGEVDGRNPISKEIPTYKEPETTEDEKKLIIEDIKNKITKSETPPSFAILLRTNRQVATWAAQIEKEGLKVLCRGDSYRQKKVFTFILAAIELFHNPWNNKIAAKLYKEFCALDKFKFDQTIFDYIKKNEKGFLHPEFLKEKEYINPDLEAFWWEAFSIVENHTLDVQEIVIACANRYFDDVIDKSNAYLFSVLIKRYTNTLVDEKFCLNYIPDIIKYFKNLLSQKTLKGINFFAKEDEDEDISGFVQIMTLHKSKGAEFDYVYLPEFTDYNYAMNFSKCCEKITKRKKTLLTKLDKIATGKEITVAQTAKEEINETLRLIYVAITRAKLGLQFSYSKKNDFNRPNSPVEIIMDLVSTPTKQ